MTDAAQMFQPLSPEERVTAVIGERPEKVEPVPIVPVPPDAPPMQWRHREHGAPSKAWPYHDAGGQVVGYVYRWDYTDAKGKPDKDFRPVTFCDLGDGRTGWAAKGFPAPRPLYRLPDIAVNPHARVLIVEGEKTADAAAALFERLYLTSDRNGQQAHPDLLVTTPPHGACDRDVIQGDDRRNRRDGKHRNRGPG